MTSAEAFRELVRGIAEIEGRNDPRGVARMLREIADELDGKASGDED